MDNMQNNFNNQYSGQPYQAPVQQTDYQQNTAQQSVYQQGGYQQGGYQQAGYQQTGYQQSYGYQKPMIPPEYEPLSPWAYFGYNLLYAIPIIGLIFLIINSVSSTNNINLRNYSRSFFIALLIGVIIFVVLMAPLVHAIVG